MRTTLMRAALVSELNCGAATWATPWACPSLVVRDDRELWVSGVFPVTNTWVGLSDPAGKALPSVLKASCDAVPDGSSDRVS